jgi:hypothetical protein
MLTSTFATASINNIGPFATSEWLCQNTRLLLDVLEKSIVPTRKSYSNWTSGWGTVSLSLTFFPQSRPNTPAPQHVAIELGYRFELKSLVLNNVPDRSDSIQKPIGLFQFSSISTPIRRFRCCSSGFRRRWQELSMKTRRPRSQKTPADVNVHLRAIRGGECSVTEQEEEN